MLSIKQQMFLINLIDSEATSQQNSYKNRKSFYKMISYMRACGIVESVEKERLNVYTLTWKGEVLARILAGFPDNKSNRENGI